ncbi:V-ATPase V1 sector subunit E [Sorochytrium milnesiophthora]
MAQRALNNDEVTTEMNKMVAFIKQEALEKAKEIKIKADEEFNIEKAKLVRQELGNIDALFQKKIKQADVQKKISQSNYINKARLRVLQARQDSLQQLFTDARQTLKQVVADQSLYRNLLRDLLVQGFFQLMEPEVTIQCRASDLPLVQSVLGEAAQIYSSAARQPINPVIDQSAPMAESELGGVVLSAHSGRIKVLNSLEHRLEIASEQMLPEFRVKLYGVPPNRRFYE